MKKIAKGFAKWFAAVFFGLFICRIASFLILSPVLLFHRRYVPLKKKRKPEDKRLAVLLPIIPDMSHHFIYRELAHIKKNFDCAIFAIDRGDDNYATPLTRYLTENITYLPALDNGSNFPLYYLSYLKYLILHPVRVANLMRLYEEELGGKFYLFVNHKSVLSRLHPIHGFYLAHLLEKEPVGHIHAYCTNMATNFTLVVAHLLDLSFSINSYADFDFTFPFKMLDKKLQLCDFDAVHTEFCRERLLGYTSEKYRDKIHLVRFGLKLDRYTPLEPSGSKMLRLVMIGGLVPKKGHRHLIKACEILKARGMDFELRIIGDGPLRKRLRELVSFLKLDDCITFVGAVPNDKLINYYTPDAILVLPSVYAPDGERDGVPTVITVALAMEMPVISTFVSGIPEVVRDRYNGLLVSPEDPHALADAIVELSSDDALRRQLVENGKRVVRERFDASIWLPKIEGLLRASLAG